MMMPLHPSAMSTSQDLMASRSGQQPARPWLPWAIAGGAIMLALMAFGAGQAMQSSTNDEPGSSVVGNPSSWDTVPPTGTIDGDCSDGVCECRGRSSCELACGPDCAIRCVDRSRCELDVGEGSSVLCDGEHCEVKCEGDCRVECAGGQCDVMCPRPDDAGGRKKKPKGFRDLVRAKRCGDVYLCGRECEDD
jgi:hypothetical protein